MYTIPNSVTSIGRASFSGCDNLENIIIGSGITNIPTYAFADNPKLHNVEIPDTVRTLGEEIFKGDTSLTSITIPDTLTSINSNAFKNCPLSQVYCSGDMDKCKQVLMKAGYTSLAASLKAKPKPVESKRTHYTLEEALDHIKKKRPGETLNDITFTFK